MNKNKIQSWLSRFNIQNYTIQDDLTVDVEGDVDISNMSIMDLPFNFGKVSGNFNCNRNALTSLKGCPREVGGSFYCDSNYLESLEFCPEKIDRNFVCSHNQITTLQYGPKTIGETFDCSANQLTSFKYGPIKVGRDYITKFNPLKSLATLKCEIGNNFVHAVSENDFSKKKIIVELVQYYIKKNSAWPFDLGVNCVISGEELARNTSLKKLNKKLNKKLCVSLEEKAPIAKRKL